MMTITDTPARCDLCDTEGFADQMQESEDGSITVCEDCICDMDLEERYALTLYPDF